MKITKLAIVISMAFALTVMVVGTVAAAPAESNRVVTPAVSIRLLDDPTPELTETPELTATTHITNPVGLALSLFLNVPYTQVMDLHQEGVGFGVIARVYLTARASNGALTPEQVLALFQSGTGWGEIMKQYGVHPGGKGLGSIMSGHAGNNSTSNNLGSGTPSCPGNSCNAPGHNKPAKTKTK
jgi:hypothetical protein